MAVEDQTYRLVLSGTNTENGDYWEQVLHYLLTGTTAAHDGFENAEELCDQWDTIRRPAWTDLIPDNVVLSAISAKKVGGGGGPTATKIVSHLGGAGSDCETIGNGAQITWMGGEDPILLGRSYFPGIPNDSLDAGVWDAAFVANAAVYITAMVTGLPLWGATVDAIFNVVSRQIGVAQQTVEHGLLRAIPGTQRRRLRR